jgi:Lon protease-like protein
MSLPDLLPLFPLPDHVLLPGVPASYRIFEPRYRTLVSELAERAPDDRWLAVPRLRPGWEEDYHGSPPIHEIAAAALARRIEPLENGEFHLQVEGLERVTLSEVGSPHPYRLARPTRLPDEVEPQAELDAGMRLLLDAVARLGDRIQLAPQELSRLLDAAEGGSRLVDRLGALLLSAPDRRQELLECRFLSRRMRLLATAMGTLDPGKPPSGGRWKPSRN